MDWVELEEEIKEESKKRKEPRWLREERKRALYILEGRMKRPPKWIEEVIKEEKAEEREIPQEVKEVLEKLGIAEIEKKILAGLGVQKDEGIVYEKLREWAKRSGVIFEDLGKAVREHEEKVKKYFGKLTERKKTLELVNTAFWKAGIFMLVKKRKKIPLPLMGFFYMSREGVPQLERSLIVVEEGGEGEYIEGCAAPTWHKSNIHGGVVEIFVENEGKLKFTTMQNWSKSINNLPSKYAYISEGAFLKWINGNIGSKTTVSVPKIIIERGGEFLGMNVSYAGERQTIISGADVVHLEKESKATILSKSVVNGGTAVYKGKVIAHHNKINTFTKCDSLLLKGTTFSLPTAVGKGISHEAKVGKVSEEVLFYLQSRGIEKRKALTLAILGFFEEFIRELKLDLAVEFKKIIEMEMEGG